MSNADVIPIDFKKYRTPELHASLRELLNVTGIYNKSSAIILLVAVGFSLLYGNASLDRVEALRIDGEISVLVYGIVAGLVVGSMFATAEVLRQSLGNMIDVVDLLLEATKRVAHDMNVVRSGDARKPSAKDIMQGVYLEVFLPIVENDVSDSLWIFGKPILFLYRFTLGRLVRRVIRMLPEQAFEPSDGRDVEAVANDTLERMQVVAENETRIVDALNWTQDKVTRIGGRLKLFVMLPWYTVCATVAIVFAIPLVVVWFS